jgi:hypothetical protein
MADVPVIAAELQTTALEVPCTSSGTRMELLPRRQQSSGKTNVLTQQTEEYMFCTAGKVRHGELLMWAFTSSSSY